ncbi:apolipoprotein B-100 [Pangasianodon hypophthalmus]|uniref:apolipoprotein B-100 n=1 Tax=Pangasianodon hypophthalmus TaxID=310915 RepID=UPI0023080894|nr:apolipoprotein B-100 [Pangasianodon hypophthalmus]
MGDTKLCLFLLLSTYALAESSTQVTGEVAGEESVCPLATRFRNFRKYIYQYTAESTNGVPGTADTKNGPRISCKVELEVPQTCKFVLHTTECALSEVTDIDAQGQPVYTSAPGTESFKAAMERSPLSFVVEQLVKVSIYPEKDEPENIVNIKKGIISALLVPVIEEEHNRIMTTIHGRCPTDLTVNLRNDIDTDVTVVRDLSTCSHFYPHNLPTSPLSLLLDLNGLLSKFITSTQTCNYQFDNKRKHMTEAQCTEKHLFIPFSQEGQYGISSEVKQNLVLQESVKINNRYFNTDGTSEKTLFQEEVEGSSFIETKEDIVTLMKTLNDLPRSGRNQERARLFHKLVSQIRGMKNETLSSSVDEMIEISKWLTWQALLQCGTSECTSAILQVLRGINEPAWEVDAIMYALSLLPQASPQRLRDMLSMAQHRQSKPIMYALANTVKKFSKDQATNIPEVKEVAEFMEFMLGDCSGDEDKTFLTLRVIGVMGKYMESFSSLKSTLLSCMRQQDASLSVQKSAIHAFRLMELDSDVTSALLQQYQDTEAPAQKRIAAYLMLMRNPDVVEEVLKTLKDEKDLQVKSFVVSHITNLLDTEDPNLQTAKNYIQKALESDEDLSPMDFTKFSHNYKIKVPWTGSVESNVIFDSANYLPREVTLATTLDTFNLELLEIGLEGEGLEPTIEALFGENGFFPDTISKAMYWANDQVPPQISKVLEKWIAPLKGSRMKREISQNILEQIKNNFDKFRQGLKSLKENKDAPKAMAYLQFMGTELGYMKTSEITGILENMMTYTNIFFSDILSQFLQKLLSATDNEVFAHYMFLDEAFTLPTGSGFPLKFSLAGIFAPGAAGGLKLKRGMQELAFKPSMGVEFVTQMGIYFPKFVDAGIRMHTNIYHESGLDSKITMSANQVKLSIPVTKENTQLLSISNELFSITSTMVKKVSRNEEDKTDSTQCSPIFPGMKYCTILNYYNSNSAHSPYYPLTGESRFAMELQPTGDVSEYTATVSYEVLKEGKEGRHKVDSLVVSLKAEGTTPTVATATLKYNRNKKILTSELQIPDFDVEAGIKLAVMDNTGKGKKMHGITIDVRNRKNLQLSLVGRARLESMEDGMLELGMAVPALQLDASATASLKKVNGLVLQFETAFNVPEASSRQKASLRYDENKIELEIKSDVNSEVTKLIPDIENYRNQLQMLIDDILDKKVAKTDMKLRHIVSKGIEAGNIWLEKFGGDIPYVRNLRSKRYIPELTLPSIPENLYFNSDALFRYQFNKGKIFFSLPLPLGGISSAELNIPSVLTLPPINVPGLGLDMPETKYKIPSFTIPQSLDFSLPLIGMGEVSAKMNTNFYDWEGSFQGGNYTDDVPSYIAKYKVMATSPLTPLSYKVEGTALVSGTFDDTFKFLVNGSLNHSFLDASFSVLESMSVSDKIREIYKLEATSPFGLETSLYYSAQSSLTDHEITADGNIDGVFKIGPLYANTTYTQSYTFNLLKEEGMGESVLRFDSSVIQGQTVTKGEYRNKELSIVSKTSAQQDALKHTAEVNYKDGQLSLKSAASVRALDKTLRIQTDLHMTKEEASFKFETHADAAANRAYSMLMASLNDKGLEVNLDGSLNFENSHGTHKGTLTFGVNGLATSCTTTFQCSSMTFENVLNAGIDGTDGASMSLITKALGQDNTVEFNVKGKISKTEVTLNSILKGNAFEGDARNTMNLALNEQGLTVSNIMTGTLQKMKTESTHTLTVTLWTLAFHSKTDSFICDGASYNHDIKVNIRPFVTSVLSNSKVEIFDITLSNDGSLKLEPFKLEATGSITGKYKEDTIKTTCGINFSDLSGSIKCDSTGDVLESQIRQNAELEFAGLSSVFKSETLFNSRSLRLENVIRTMAMPLSLTVDGILNIDGSVNWYGKHTGQLYSKFLLKAEPFAIANSHDLRASATHMLPNGNSAETHIENKFDGLLIPNEQSILWKFKSKLNNHAYNQDISIYNKEADMGVQLSSVLHTNLLSGESSDNSLDTQEFSISGFLKYDKNSDCHIIDLPFIESLPVAFEKMKITIVNLLESLQQYLNGLDINDLVRQFRENLDKVPQNVRYYMEELDLENKLNIAKDKVVSLARDYAVTWDDLEASMEKLKIASEKTLIDFAIKIRDIKAQIKDFIESGSWTKILEKIGNELKTFDERYGITSTILKVINAFEDVISQIDLQKLQDSSMNWLRKLDAKYDIRAKLQTKLSELKQAIEAFDITKFVQDVISYISSFDLEQYVNQLSDHIPAEDIEKVIDSIKDVIVNWIEEYELVEKINYVYSKIGELFQRYEIEKKMELFIEQATTLIQQYKIHKTVEAMVETLKSIPFEYFSDKIIELLHAVVSELKLVDIKRNIDELNNYIQMIIRNLKTFDYNEFVNEANEKISKLINYINEQIMLYEIPQKIEASRDFLRDMHTSIVKYLEQLKNTKVAELYRMIKGVIDRTAYKDIKLKIQDTLEDMRQRIQDMDIRDEILVYLERASESYNNMLAYISSQLHNLIEIIRKVSGEQEILTQIQQAMEEVLSFLKKAKIEILDFTIPFTTLHVPAFDISLSRLQDMNIPSVITIPAFTVLDFVHVSSVSINFEEIKQKIIEFIDQIRAFEIPELDPEATFGDLRALYWYYLPDFTLPEIRLVELKFPEINIPKLNLENFEITMLRIPDIKLPHIVLEPCVPAFGKLYGEFQLKSPHYTIMTAAAIQNTTTTSLEPQFKATLTSEVKSTLEVLGYSLDAMLQIEAPNMEKMVISETIKASHMAFTISHEGSLIFSGPSAEATAKTDAKATTQMYKADLTNNVGVILKNGISVNMNTNYNHDINIPSMKISSQATITKNAEARLESGTISVTCRNVGNGKWSIRDYADEGIHKSNLEFSVNSGTAKLTFDGETNSKILIAKQSVNAESVILSHTIIDVTAETETPFMKKSVMRVTGKAQMEGLRIELTASHNAELTGRVSGTLSNSCEFLAHPFEITLDCKNQGNSKIVLPLKLTGKIDLKQDYKMILNSEKQHIFWVGLTRFNQYKYNHNFTLDNRENDAGIYVSVDGEANLDFLTVPLNIPEMTLPGFGIKTPMIKDFSLWEDFGLKDLLTTPRQSFDIDFKLQYQKNMDKHTFNLDLEPIYESINENAKILGVHFELGRDKVFDALTNSYNQARTQFEKFNIDTSKQPPRYFTVPGYTVPLLNIEVSAFRAELPAVSYFIPKEVSTPSFKVPMMGFSVPSYTLVLPSLELPVLYVPETLRELTLPTFTLPNIQNNIMIPALGNVTYDFSFKSPVITVNSNGGLYNQSDIVVKLGASSTSVFEFLKGKLDGTTSITRKRCLKVATTLSLEHKNAAYTHDSSVSLTKRSIEASLANVIKINLPVFTMDLNQQLRGNTKTKPNFASNMKVDYTYTLPALKSEGKGNMQHDLVLEALSSYFSVESSLRGKTDGTIMEKGHFSESLDNDAIVYLNSNGLRFTLKTAVTSDVDYKKAKIWNMDMTENVELEASLRRVYATVNYTNNNEVNIASFSTNGKHTAKGTIEFVPLTTLSASLNIDMSQPSNLGLANIMENVDLAVTSGKQKFIWSSKEQLASIKHSSDMMLSNDESEIRMEIAESVEGHLAFLKSIRLPIYQKTLWDVMKFDEATSPDQLQVFNVATHLVYTKSMDGTLFSLPAKVFENGVVFNIPKTTLTVPNWMKQIPQIIREMDQRLENVDMLDSVSIPPVITVPTFDMPLTTLRVPSFTLDLQNLQIPDSISMDSFDITLPGLPKVKVPSFEINTKYIKEKMSFLLLKLPQYEITISPFTLPKSFTIGEHTISLDDPIKAICNFEMPAITIPEQKIEIPEISLHLPVSVFIPSFGALSTSVKVSSPIYNNTWTAKVENKEPGFVYTLKSSCTSTMTFLGYDLEAVASVLLDNGAMSLDGKCTFSHNDVKVNWKHDLHQNLRIKREEPSASRPPRHTLDIDVTSQTFADVKFRYASHNNGITSSVSYPDGFVGFQLTRKSPSQYYAKLFTRSLSSPDKDTDLLSFKVTLKNSERLNLQTSWQLNGFFDMVNGIKVKLPDMTAALYNFVNKYHKAHFGIDLNRAALKLKNAIANNIDRAYSNIPRAFDAIQNSVEHLSQQSKAMMEKTMKSMPEINFQDVISRVSNNVKELLQHYESNVRVLLDAVMKFLSETKFQLPGLEEKFTGQELYYKMRRSVSMAVRRAASRFTSLMETIFDTISSFVSEINFSLPTTNVIVNGKDILRNLKSAVKSTQDRIIQAMKKWEGLKLENVLQNISDFVKLCIQRTGEFITSLKAEKLDELSNHLKGIYTEASNTPAMQELARQIELAKTNAAEYKDKTKLKVQEVYNGISMENLNSQISESISVLENHLRANVENIIEYSKKASQHTQPYIKVTSKKVDVDIPLPFYWNSFSEWPSMT